MRARFSMSAEDHGAIVDLLGAVPRVLGLLRSQYWSRARIEGYQRSRLAEVLAAARRIPFYAARIGSRPRPEAMADLPILQREDIPALAASVLEQDPGAALRSALSSGSTGMQARFVFDAAHQRGRFAARARYLLANGWSPLQRGVWFMALHPGSPDAQLMHSRWLPRLRFISHLTPFAEQAELTRAADPHYLYSLPSNLEGLLEACEAAGTRFPSLRKVFTGGEVLETSLRRRVERVLGVSVADNYGSTEVFLAFECPDGENHVNAEHAFIEIIHPSGRPARPGEMGEVLVTTLENRAMPLVRWAIGDWAIADGAELCVCGRGLPRLGAILGRTMNLFRTAGGSLLSPWQLVDPVKKFAGLRQFQIVQKAIDRFSVRVVAADPLDPEVERAARAEFARFIGPEAAVSFERVAELARAPSGKFMTAISEVQIP